MEACLVAGCDKVSVDTWLQVGPQVGFLIKIISFISSNNVWSKNIVDSKAGFTQTGSDAGSLSVAEASEPRASPGTCVHAECASQIAFSVEGKDCQQGAEYDSQTKRGFGRSRYSSKWGTYQVRMIFIMYFSMFLKSAIGWLYPGMSYGMLN